MSRATYGSPRRMCQSAGLRAAAWTRTSTSPGPGSGTSVSASRRTSGGPNRSWRIAFNGWLLRTSSRRWCDLDDPAHLGAELQDVDGRRFHAERGEGGADLAPVIG